MDLTPVFIMFGLLAVLITLGVPISFALLLSSVPPILMEDRLQLYIFAQKSYNALDSFLLLAIPLFLVAGILMNATGVTQRLVRLASALVGHTRGGLAQITVVVSMIFAGVSGSSIAEAAGTGTVLIPAMKKAGFPPEFSVALIAAASVMGVIIPPSLNMIVWGAVNETSVGDLFIGGIAPGLLIGFGMMGWVYVVSRQRGFPVEARKDVREILLSIGGAWLALVMPVLIIGGVRAGLFTPTEAAISAVLYALFLGFVAYRSLNPAALTEVLFESARLASRSLFCVASAGVFGFLLAYYQVPQSLTALADLFQSPVFLLTFVSMVFLLLGTFLDGMVIIIICSPLFLPAVMQMGIHPVHYGIVGCIAIAMGLITPPYGLCLLLASSIGGVRMQDALPDAMRLLGVMGAVLALAVLFPALSLGLAGLHW